MEKNYSSYDDLSDKEVELLSSSQPQQTEDKSDESSDPDSMELDSSGSELDETKEHRINQSNNITIMNLSPTTRLLGCCGNQGVCT